MRTVLINISIHPNADPDKVTIEAVEQWLVEAKAADRIPTRIRLKVLGAELSSLKIKVRDREK